MQNSFSDLPLPVLITGTILGLAFLTGVILFVIQWVKETKNKPN